VGGVLPRPAAWPVTTHGISSAPHAHSLAKRRINFQLLSFLDAHQAPRDPAYASSTCNPEAGLNGPSVCQPATEYPHRRLDLTNPNSRAVARRFTAVNVDGSPFAWVSLGMQLSVVLASCRGIKSSICWPPSGTARELRQRWALISAFAADAIVAVLHSALLRYCAILLHAAFRPNVAWNSF
jgi:hypothetical protein